MRPPRAQAAGAWPATGGAAAAAGRVCDAGGAATPALSAPLWGRSSRGFTASSAALATVRPPPRDDAPAKQSFLSARAHLPVPPARPPVAAQRKAHHQP
jgi:hypothetical protein